MPWEVVGNCVHKKGSDKPIPGGCHDTPAEAQAHLRALYANEPEAGKSWSERNRQLDQIGPASLIVTKQADGSYRWVLISSSAFEDRDGEIVSTKALQADVDRADADGEFGPLRWWHLPGADIGDCDFNMLHGRMLYESGTFRSSQVAEAVKEHAGELGASIGFTHPANEPDAAGVFHNIRRFERSLLPRELASNPFTTVSLVEKESAMTLIEDKLKAFGKILGGDASTVAQVLAIGATKEAEAEAAGIRTKAKDEKPDADAPPKTEDGKLDKPFSQDEAEDDEKPKAEKKEYVGDMEPAALEALITKAVDGRLSTLKAELQTQLDSQATTKAAAEASTAETLKAYETKLDAIAASSKAALDGVAELKGELPRRLGERLKGFHASTDGEEPGETLKDRLPAPDPANPLDKFLASLKAANGAAPQG